MSAEFEGSSVGKFDFALASKFPPGTEYLDINYLWVPGLRRVVGFLYPTRIKPEAVVGMSLIAGGLAACAFALSGYVSLVVGTIFIQLKNYLDTVDGHLARARRLDSRIGRFLDSLCDFAVYLMLFGALSLRFHSSGGWTIPFLSCAAMASAFIQCSYYNYYLVAYLRLVGGRTQSRNHEGVKEEAADQSSPLLMLLKWIYLAVYGWQDRLVAWVDGRALSAGMTRALARGESKAEFLSRWYADKRLMTANSPLCFGTQILALSIFALSGHPTWFVYFLLGPANFYLLSLLFVRARLGRVEFARSGPGGLV